MEDKEILSRLREIVVQKKVRMADAPVADACWLDGERCPYGSPHGRYNDRPQTFCHFGEGGCKRLTPIKEGLDSFLDGVIEDGVEKAIKQATEKERVSLSSELEVIGKLREMRGPAEEVLKLASEIIKDSAYNRDIIRVEDI